MAGSATGDGLPPDKPSGDAGADGAGETAVTETGNGAAGGAADAPSGIVPQNSASRASVRCVKLSPQSA